MPLVNILQTCVWVHDPEYRNPKSKIQNQLATEVSEPELLHSGETGLALVQFS